MPAQIAEAFSSWQVAEQPPSPLVVLPSSHSSLPSTRPLPHVRESGGDGVVGGEGEAGER